MKLGTTTDGQALLIDLDRLVVNRVLLQANSGGGKSWALRRLLEQTHGRVQNLVLDIEGEFHTLRERFDYVLAAKTGGDTLADVRSAPLLARRLLELGVSAIVDLYELKAADRVRFVRLFLEALIDAPRKLWHPALVVVDEAHHFCPQQGQAESAGAVIDLMTRGRKRGFCGVLATQRLSKLHKDAAAEANCKLIGRAALDVDVKRAADELGLSSREDLARLRSLPAGRFFAFGPGLSDQVVEVQVGDVSTTHPRAGRGAAPVPPPREKVQKVLAQLADLPKEAEQEARTLQQAQARIRELERQVRAAPAAPAAKVERVEVPVLKDAQIAKLGKLAERAAEAVGRAQDLTKQLAEACATLVGLTEPVRQAARIDRTHGFEANGRVPAGNWRGGMPAPNARLPAAALATVEPRPLADGAAVANLGRGGDRRMLVALAQNPAGLTQSKLALVSGIARRGGTFRTYLGKLRSSGLAESRGDLVAITQAGLEAAGDVPPMPTGDDLVEHWRRELGAGGLRALFDALVDAFPESLTRAELAERAGIAESGGTFRTYVGKLRTLELVTGGSDSLRAAEDLFTGSTA